MFGDRVRATVERADRDAPALARALREGGLEAVEVEEVEPGMEDVFMDRLARAGPDAGEAAPRQRGGRDAGSDGRTGGPEGERGGGG